MVRDLYISQKEASNTARSERPRTSESEEDVKHVKKLMWPSRRNGVRAVAEDGKISVSSWSLMLQMFCARDMLQRKWLPNCIYGVSKTIACTTLRGLLNEIYE